MQQLTLNETTAAQRRVLLPQAVQDADGITPVTGLTPAAADLKLSKNGAAEASSAGTFTELTNGYYSYEGTAGEVDTRGYLMFRWNASTVRVKEVVVQVGGLVTSNLTQIDGQVTTGNNATLNLKQLNIVNSAGSAVIASSTGSNGHGIRSTGNGSGSGLSVAGGGTGHGINADGGATSGNGITATAPTSGDGFKPTSTVSGNAVGTAEATQVAAAVFNQALSSYTTAGTFGQSAQTIRNGTAQSATGTTIVLDAGASAIDSFYNDLTIQITAGLGVNQARVITAYVGATKTATVGTWGTNPDVTSVFTIQARGLGSGGGASAATIAAAVWDKATSSHVADGTFGQTLQEIRTGTAQAGAAGTITLDAGASAVDSFYNNTFIQIIGGTGTKQARFISAYVGATKVATLGANWVTNPDNTSVFVIHPFAGLPGASAPTAADNANAVWDALRSAHTAALSFGGGIASVTGSVASVAGNVVGTIGGLTTPAKAEVNTEVQNVVVANNLDHLAKTAAVVGDVVDSSILARITSKSATPAFSSFDNTTDSLEALRDQTFPSVAAIADQVWDEARADHTTAGTYGQGSASVQGNVTGSVASVTGNVSGNVAGTVGSVVGAVGSVTGNVGGNVVGSVASVTGNVAGNVNGSVGSVAGNVSGNVVGSVGSVAGVVVGSVGSVAGNVSGSVGSLAAQAKTDVNNEVVDVLYNDVIPELAQAQPPITPTIAQAVMFPYMIERNDETETASQKSVKNNAGTLITKSAISDDGTTLTKAKYLSGP